MSDCDVCISGGYDCEPCEFFEIIIRTARKFHRCSECDTGINKGEKYQRCYGKSDGEFWTFNTCMICAEIRKVFTCDEGEELGGILWERMADYAFPKLTTASPCFRECSAAAKAEVLRRWRIWKGLEVEAQGKEPRK
jgi:hypothetical protein